MAFLGDYHTHTQYSRSGGKLHGKSTVLDNARAAAKIGLKELAITDHGFGHVFGVKGAVAFDALKEECLAASEETGVAVYAGLENNLDPKSGKRKDVPPLLNLDETTLGKLEIVQGGYHAYIGTPRMFPNMLFWTRNSVFGWLPHKKLMAHNTEAYIRLIDEYPIDFIGHIGRGIVADVVEVARYAHSKGVYIELNGRHKTLDVKQIKLMAESGVEFICNSDAHNASDVGRMTLGEELIKASGISYESIANWDRLPEFRSRNFRDARTSRSAGGERGDD